MRGGLVVGAGGGSIGPAAKSREFPRTRHAAARDERWLAGVWQKQAFDRHDLQTTCGLPFKLVYPGRRTGEAGPDFHDAILALADGSLLRGDVELHLDSGGWQQHGHHLDPAYNRVVLHVVIDARKQVRNLQGEPVLTLELAGRLRRSRQARPRERQASGELATDCEGAQLSYLVQPCRHTLPDMQPRNAASLLQALALERFQAKQAVFEGELAVYEPQQTLYAGIMEALGYSRNKRTFRELAQLVPLNAFGSQASSTAIDQLLSAGAGLLECHENSALLANAGLIARPMTASDWLYVGVRPDNWPQRRIRQFAAILSRLGPAKLLDALLAPLAELDGGCSNPRAGVARLRCEWQRQLAEVGRQRADAIAVNVLLPFAAAYGQATCQFLLSDTAAQVFLAYPAQGANQVTGYMRRTILGPLATSVSGAAGEQALMQVWDRWCHDKVCALCPLGRRTTKNTELRMTNSE